MRITYTEYQMLKSMVSKYEKEMERMQNYSFPNPHKTRLLIDMDLSIRLYGCLKKFDIKTIDQLAEKSVNELMAIRNFGKNCLAETKELLKEYDLELKK
ncbi:MAG: DNA-directed RNA polymerase subunit alpha C-terminal domain-containing protein [Bacteroidota bacterium]